MGTGIDLIMVVCSTTTLPGISRSSTLPGSGVSAITTLLLTVGDTAVPTSGSSITALFGAIATLSRGCAGASSIAALSASGCITAMVGAGIALIRPAIIALVGVAGRMPTHVSIIGRASTTAGTTAIVVLRWDSRGLFMCSSIFF